MENNTSKPGLQCMPCRPYDLSEIKVAYFHLRYRLSGKQDLHEDLFLGLKNWIPLIAYLVLSEPITIDKLYYLCLNFLNCKTGLVIGAWHKQLLRICIFWHYPIPTTHLLLSRRSSMFMIKVLSLKIIGIHLLQYFKSLQPFSVQINIWTI